MKTYSNALSAPASSAPTDPNMVANPVGSASTTMPIVVSTTASDTATAVIASVGSTMMNGDRAPALDPTTAASNPTARVGAKGRKTKTIFLDSLAPAEGLINKAKKVVKPSQQATVGSSVKKNNRVIGKPPVKEGKIGRSLKSPAMVVESDEEANVSELDKEPKPVSKPGSDKVALPSNDLRNVIDPSYDLRNVIDQAFENQVKYDTVYFFKREGRREVRKMVTVKRSKPLDSGRIKLYLTGSGDNSSKILPAEWIKNSKLCEQLPGILERDLQWPRHTLTFQREVEHRPATKKQPIGRIYFGNNKPSFNYLSLLDIREAFHQVPMDDNPIMKSLKDNLVVYAMAAGVQDESESDKASYKSRPKITKLKEDNYHSWRTNMSVTLEAMGLWNVEKELPKSGRETWREIMLAVEDSQHVTIEKLKDGLEAWLALAKHHEKSGIASVLSELRRFFLTKFEGGSLEKHCAELISAQRKLDRLGHPIDDTVVIAVLLNSLPDRFEPMIYAWDAIGEKLKLDDVVSKLVNMPERDDQQFAGLSARDMSQVKCFICEKFGHFARDCKSKANVNKAKGNAAKEKKKEWKPKKERGNSAKSKSNKDDTNMSWGLAVIENKLEDSEWLLDSGASQHLSGTKSFLTDLKPTTKGIKVVIADGTEFKATHTGTLKIKGLGIVKEVYYTPGLETNMLSIAKLSENGFDVQFKGTKCTITKNESKFECDRYKGMYRVYAYSAQTSGKTLNEKEKRIQSTNMSLNKVHEIMGHVHTDILKEMIKNGQMKIWNVDTKESDPCEICLKGKLVRTNIPTESSRENTERGALILSDVWGPAQQETHEGYRYYVIFIDDYSRYSVLFLMKKKSEVFSAFKTLVQLLKTQLNVSVKKLRSDNGEYTSNEFKKYCQEMGIQQQFTTAHSSFQNGVAERHNRTLLEGTRCLLIGANLNKRFWGEAVTHMNLLRNLILKKGEEKTPYEKFHKLPPSYTDLYQFGAITYVLKHDQKKLDPKAEKGLYMGKDANRKAIKVWVIDRKKVISSRDFKVLKHNPSVEREKSPTSGKRENNNVPDIDDLSDESSDQQMSSDEEVDGNETINVQNREVTHEESEHEEYYTGDEQRANSNEQDSEEDEVFNHPTAGKWKMGYRPMKWDLSNLSDKRERRSRVSGMAAEVKISIKEALSNSKWKIAMDSEMESQNSKSTWKIVKRPEGKKILRCRWVYVIKKNQDDQKFKARLVVGGHKQTFGIDYEETFAPVVKYQSIRILLALATVNNWEVHQMDFVTAFLNASLDEEIYMEQPPGYENGNPDEVCLLIKGLYGLKQSPRQWNKKYKEIMVKLGFVCITADESVFVNGQVIVGVYVDDLIIVSPHLQKIEKFKKDIKKEYDVKDLGELSVILSMKWTRNREERTSFLSQQAYAEEILERFSMSDCKSAGTPGVNLEAPEIEKKVFEDKTLYMQACGSLSHLQNCTRPDITFAVGMACRKMQDPNEQDWMAVKRILRYIKGTTSFGVKFGSNAVKVTGYGDADWAGCHDSRKSTSGYVFLMGSGAVAWASKKQLVVALSSVEAEYISGSLAVQEAIWENKFLEEIGIKAEKPLLYQDNQGAIAFANNPIQHARTKHIDVRHYFMKDAVLKDLVTLKYCPTQDMVADVLTKHLGRIKFEEFRKSMGIVERL